ncbi:hypothetical protein CDL12_00458 [Handroanthus impetiginosus]|uniref:Rapid ALkalinization Factor n=1 Tax=Handroanthus impetiginosus TaxID=429701 RepID=A0A2G9IAL5_9LAMI|nr:hypothetical protein CDL12_00458 [Handroanthus impetiginosus]
MHYIRVQEQIKRLTMKNINQHSFLQLGVALALILVLLSDAAAAHAPVEIGFSATRTPTWLTDNEFLMESETNRRILATTAIGYNALNPNRPFCGKTPYENCIGQKNTAFDRRKCDYKNHCKRAPAT